VDRTAWCIHVLTFAPPVLGSGASQALRSIVKEPLSEGVTLLRFRFAPHLGGLLLRVPRCPQDVVALLVCPALQCRHSLFFNFFFLEIQFYLLRTSLCYMIRRMCSIHASKGLTLLPVGRN